MYSAIVFFVFFFYHVSFKRADFPDGPSDAAGKRELGVRAGRVQAAGILGPFEDVGRMVDGGQTEIIPGHDRVRRRLRQADNDGRRDGEHGGPDSRRTRGRPLVGHPNLGHVLAAARLENVPAVLRLPAGRLP